MAVVVLSLILPHPGALSRGLWGVTDFVLLVYVYISFKFQYLLRRAPSSFVEIRDDRLYFNLVPMEEFFVHLDEIVEVRPFNSASILEQRGLKTNFLSWMAFITAGQGAVMLEFKHPVPVPVFRLLPLKVKRLILTLENDREFVAALPKD